MRRKYLEPITGWRSAILPILLFTFIAVLFVITTTVLLVTPAHGKTISGKPDIIETPCHTVFLERSNAPRMVRF